MNTNKEASDIALPLADFGPPEVHHDSNAGQDATEPVALAPARTTSIEHDEEDDDELTREELISLVAEEVMSLVQGNLECDGSPTGALRELREEYWAWAAKGGILDEVAPGMTVTLRKFMGNAADAFRGRGAED